MNLDIIYTESVRQFNEGNKADSIINKKIDFLLVSSFLFIGYFFTVDSFINIFISGDTLTKHIFIAGFFSLLVSLFFTIRAFLLVRFKRGLKIDSIERIIKKHPTLQELSLINFALKDAIKYNYERQKRKNKHFFKGFIFLSLSILFFIISKINFLI